MVFHQISIKSNSITTKIKNLENGYVKNRLQCKTKKRYKCRSYERQNKKPLKKITPSNQKTLNRKIFKTEFKMAKKQKIKITDNAKQPNQQTIQMPNTKMPITCTPKSKTLKSKNTKSKNPQKRNQNGQNPKNKNHGRCKTRLSRPEPMPNT